MKALMVVESVSLSEGELWAIADRCGLEHSQAGWERADAWAELNGRFSRWTTREIAERAKYSQPYVTRCISISRDYPGNQPRGNWVEVYGEVKGGARTLGTGEDEWYTPSEYVELARHVLGGIDLDPASCSKAQEWIRAGRFFTEDGDGLAMPWTGRVWMNPPYSQPKINHFVSKLLSEYEAKRVTSAIVLTTNNTDTSWFHALASQCSAICFTAGRVSFIAPDGKKPSPNQGHVFTYFGSIPEKFVDSFSSVGAIFVRS